MEQQGIKDVLQKNIPNVTVGKDDKQQVQCPTDFIGYIVAMKANPDKDNFYPVQINSCEELYERVEQMKKIIAALTKRLEAVKAFQKQIQ